MEEDIKILRKYKEEYNSRLHVLGDYPMSFEETECLERVLDRLEQLEKENKELKEKMGKAYKYITDEMYIDDNPTMCGDEWEDTITELPISLHLYNKDLRELLDLLD
jgi:DNA-binding ferritin-like protein (Dps family)